MATSGTVTYRTNRNQVIFGALRLVSAYDPENTVGPTTNQIALGAEALNLMVKALEAKGLQLWERRYGVIFPQTSQQVYALGNPGPAGDHACLTTPLGTGGFVQTTLASAAASAATSIVVSAVSSAGTVGTPAVSITDTYYIGIQLDSGALQWTTVSGAPSGTTVTLAAALTGDASEGNYVYCYQTKLVRPLRILDGFVRNVAGGNDTPVSLLSREQYNRFGVKTSAGTPVQLYYDQQANTGYVYTYPIFSVVSQLLYIEIDKPIDDFSTSTDDFDLPQEWGEYLKFGLALRLAPEYEVPKEKYAMIKDLATAAFDLVNGWDQEDTSLLIQPNLMFGYNNGNY
jgi:hypothetical protein